MNPGHRGVIWKKRGCSGENGTNGNPTASGAEIHQDFEENAREREVENLHC
jgi:hypothetical protein